MNSRAVSKVSLLDIPYRENSRELFDRIRTLHHSAWLDSGRPFCDSGRYDIMVAEPISLLQTRGDSTEITSGADTVISHRCPFELVENALSPLRVDTPKDIPFCGGALGYFSYDLNRRLENIPEQAEADIELPDMHVGIYAWAVVQDHQQRHAWFVCLPQCDKAKQQQLLDRFLAEGPVDHQPQGFHLTGSFRPDITQQDYSDAILKIQNYIREGDCYQVNFAQRFSAQCQGDSYAAYCQLREAIPTPYSAFMAFGPDQAVLCHSPERFLQASGEHVETKPIKGTIARGSSPEEDRLLAQKLLSSPKDRAENLMIVDLLRNDLSKNCTKGSVRVPTLFALESFPNVHHLVSTVTGTLKAGSSALALLRDCFPGGSITGAPKVRAMEIIEELEPCRRSVYCGSLGYISANGNMDTNIAIRTLVRDGDSLYGWGGGGIVADSTPGAEYQESLDKIGLLLRTLETP